MTDYIETKAKDGTPVRIEVELSSKSGAGFSRTTSASDATSDTAKAAYNQALDTIRVCANGVIGTLQELEAAPNTASVSFGIKFDADAGAMVAKSMNEAQFKVSLSWKEVEPDSDEGEEKEE